MQTAAWWWAAAAALALLMLPLTIVDVPPLTDLPNHLARGYILADRGADQHLATYYRSAWRVIPNLGTDLLLPPLIRLTTPGIAARLVLALAILLCFAGMIMLHRTCFHRRCWWPLAGTLVVYNAAFLMGFVNFVLGTGAALCAAALWLSRPPAAVRLRALLGPASVMLLFFLHIIAAAYFLLIIVSQALGRAIGDRPVRIRSIVAALRPTVAPALLLPALYGLTPDATGSQLGATWSTLKMKAGYTLDMFASYSRPLDVAAGVTCAAWLGYLAVAGRLVAPQATLLALTVAVMLFIVLPCGFGGGGFLDARVPILVAMLIVSGLDTKAMPEIHIRASRIAFGALFFVRMAVIATAWLAARQDLQDIRNLAKCVPRGARVIAFLVPPGEEKDRFYHDQPAVRELRGISGTDLHLPALWVIERQIFYPFLFANPAQQPLEIMPAYLAHSAPLSHPPDYRLLRPAVASATQGLIAKRFPADWRSYFDYVVVLNAGRDRDQQSRDKAALQIVGSTDIADLYRVCTHLMRARGCALPTCGSELPR